MADNRQFSMVGVARIELATPAMSTKRLGLKCAVFRLVAALWPRTGVEQTPIRATLYRRFTA